MNIKTATGFAILGIGINLFAGLGLHLMQLGHTGGATDVPASYYIGRALAFVAFAGMDTGLLVFLVTLYRRQ
ncbi:MAG: hypothetical protein FJ224_08515 [Lentisphaerae bacterium]|nr:hypothetical protein [Lentisphaerota bacterium]